MDETKLLLVQDTSITLETEEINKVDNYQGARERLTHPFRDIHSDDDNERRVSRLYSERLPEKTYSREGGSGNCCESRVKGLIAQEEYDDSDDQSGKIIRSHKRNLTSRKRHSKCGWSRKYSYKGKPNIQDKDHHYSSRKNSKYTRLATSSKGQVNHESSEGDGVDDGYNFQVVGGERELAEVLHQSADHTAQELQNCKKILNPYLTFLQLVGWRCWRASHQHLTMPRCVFFLNVVYPFLFFVLLIFACVSQVFTCFVRHGNPRLQFTRGNESRITIRNVECTEHLVSEIIIPDILLLVSYLWGIYLFRFKESESLPSLMESVYISFNSNDRKNSQKRLSVVLRMCLSLAVVWLALSLAGNILRLLSLRLLYDNTHISSLTFHQESETGNHTTVEDVVKDVLVIYSLFSFFLFDLLYVAVVLTYIASAQLLLTYISCIIDKVRIKAYSLDKAVTNIVDIHKFLQVLNREVATPTSLCLYIFIAAAISSVLGLAQVSEKEGKTFYWLVVSMGCVNFLQWSILSLAPIAQAAHLTAYCRRLSRLGLEIAARPHMYTNTHQLLLMSFLEYTSFTRFTARLASVPISPAVLFGFLFLFGLLANLLIEIYNPFAFARWI